MKQILLLAGLFLGCAGNVFAQGQVIFSNRVTGSPGVFAPIYGPSPNNPYVRLAGNAMTNGGGIDYTGVPLLTGTGFTAALFGGPAGTPEHQLQFLASAPFRTVASLAGIFVAPSTAVAVPGVNVGEFATFQVRAWDNQGGTVVTWASVLAFGQDHPHGVSTPFTTPLPLGGFLPNGDFITPPPLVGLTSFNIFLPVPEPSVGPLAAAGIAVFWLAARRRRERDKPRR